MPQVGEVPRCAQHLGGSVLASGLAARQNASSQVLSAARHFTYLGMTHNTTHLYLNLRRRSELLITVTDESAIAAAAKIGACACRKGISGERMAVGIRIIL